MSTRETARCSFDNCIRILLILKKIAFRSAEAPSSSLATNLLRVVLAIYLSLALLLTAGQLALEYQNEKRRLTQEIESVAATFNPIISKALWNVDEEQTRASLKGVLGINYDVLNTQLLDANDNILYEFDSSAEKNHITTRWRFLQALTDRFKENYDFAYDLYYASEFTQQQKIGRLILHSNSNVVLHRAAHTFMITVISAIFKTGLLALVFYLIMRHMVARPLKRITHAMLHLDPRNQGGNPGGDFSPRLLMRDDELGAMAKTFQELVQALQEKDKALKAHADQLEAKVRERTQQLEEASQAKSDFLASVSHEIRTPMNGIIGLAHLLEGTELNTQQRQYVEVIQNSGNALIHIINDILDHLKIESKKIELEETAFDIRAIFDECVALFSHRAREGEIEVSASFAHDCPHYVRGDPTRLRQILLNILSNAFKFTQHGAITITAHCEPFVDGRVKVTFTIIDTGIGIDASRLHRLFKPFSQADSSTTRRFGGTGLGLAICKQLVELMGGTIGVHSEPGKGSRFWFSIPFNPAAAPSVAARQPSKPVAASPEYPNLAQLRVLVAEDNPVNQMVIVGQLKKYNIEPVVVENGRLAVEYCADHPATLDLILMDGEMPLIDGWKAAAMIRDMDTQSRTGSPIPIFAMTAHTRDTYEESASQHRMNGFLAKPINPSKLQQILREAYRSLER